MNIVLINPNRIYFKDSLGLDMTIQRSGVPLGLLYLSSYLKKIDIKKDFNINIIDCLVSTDTILETRKNYIFQGLADNILIEKIQKLQPSIIGITVNFTSQASPALEICSLIKKNFPSVKIVIGGCHATVEAENILKNYPEIDFVIRAEGEWAFSELAIALKSNLNYCEINNLAYRDTQHKNKIVLNPIVYNDNLDSLPFPDFSLVDMELYFKRRSLLVNKWNKISKDSFILKLAKKILMGAKRRDLRDITIISSRGCPFQCIFCSIFLQNGRKWRAHSAEYIVRYLEYLIQNYKIEYIHFEDDNMSFNAERFRQILAGIKAKNLDFKWDFPNGIRADTLDGKMIREMKQLGCEQINVGIESGDQDILNNVIKKAINLEKIEEILKICQEEKLEAGAFFVLGIPGETLTTMNKTVSFAHYLEKKYGTIPHLGIAVPLVGTRMFDICKKNNYFNLPPTPDNYGLYSKGNYAMISTSEFSSKDILNLYRKFYHFDNFFLLFYYQAKKWTKRIFGKKRVSI